MLCRPSMRGFGLAEIVLLVILTLFVVGTIGVVAYATRQILKKPK